MTVPAAIPADAFSDGPEVRERCEWLDVARGIGIILIVYGHVFAGLMAAGIILPTAGTPLTVYLIYSFHVQLLFLLSGLHVRTGLARGAGSFMSRRIRTIIYPYFIWSLIQGGAQIAFSAQTNGSATLETLGAILWTPITPFWFLYALMVYHLLALVLKRMPTPVVFLVAAATFLASFFLEPGTPPLLLRFFLFYALGWLFAERIFAWSPPRFALGGLALVWGGWLAAVLVARKGGWQYDTAPALPAALLGIAGTLWVSKLLAGRAARWLAALGRVSMSVFVMHVLAGSGTRIALGILGLPPDPIVYGTICLAAGIGLPVLVHLALSRLELLPAFGLAPPSVTR
jgi:fucose 4-O-acetylase-like acetyltransferase